MLMHLQLKALAEKCSVKKGVLQNAVMHCTAMFLWWKSLKNTCGGLLFYATFSLQPVTS